MKKRLSKLALLAVAAAFVLVGFPACSDDDDGEEPSPVVLASIQVQNKPTKTTYNIDDDFDPTGLVVREVYSDNRTTDVPYTEKNKGDFKFTGFDATKASDSVTVTVTYKKMTTTFTVTVATNKHDPEKTIDSIAVTTPPTKQTYTVGDTTIDADGLVIKVTYSDEKTDPIVYSDENKDDFAFEFDSSTAGESVTVTVTYKEKTAEFTVAVAANKPDPEKTIDSIAVETPPTKVAYTVGDTTIDADGLVIKVTYSDNTTDPIVYGDENKDDFAFEFDSSTAGESVTVTVTYKEKMAEFTVSVKEKATEPTKTLSSIAVKDKPTKLAYTVGDTLDPAGLVITATYSDKTTEDIDYNTTDFTLTGFDATKASESVTVTVKYKEMTATFTVSVAADKPAPEKTLTGIAVKDKPTKLAYMVGDTTLDPAGLVITATYSDKTTEDIDYNTTDFTLTGFDATKASESVTVTVKYKEMTATFTVSVAEPEKSLFETLSAQENNILAEDFAAYTVKPFGAGFGVLGVYGADGVTVTDGAISTGSGTNRKIHVDFGSVKETVEGCVTLTVGGTQPQSGKTLLTFYNGDTAFLTIKTGTGDNTVGGIAGTYEIYYKFDLTAKTVSLKVNNTDVLTDSALTADSVSGYTIESHNGGKGTVAADNIAVCATKGDLSTYKAQVKAWLATLVTNTYSEEKGYKTNKAAVDLAKSTGDSAIDAAADFAAVLTAYGNAKAALGQVKNDVAQAKENACTELDAYFPTGKTAESYTEEQLGAVTAAKEAGTTAINAAASVEAVNAALAEAKAKIDALPDSSATVYTVTVITNDGTTLGTVDAYKDVASVLDEIKKLITDPKQVIAGGKFYSDSTCTTEYDTATELTGDVTVYVKLEEKKTTTYVLIGSDIANTTFTNTDNAYTDKAVNDIFYLSQNGVSYSTSPVGIKLGGKLQVKKSHIKFTTTGQTTITLTFTQTSNTTNRYAQYATIDVANKSLGTIVQGEEGAVKGTTVTTVFKDIPAGTYAVAGSDAILITELKVEVAEAN